MTNTSATVLFITIVGGPKSDTLELDRLKWELRDDLLALGIGDVEDAPSQNTPDGEKGPISVGLVFSTAAIMKFVAPKIIDLIYNLFTRNDPGAIILKAGDRELTITKPTTEQQQAVVDKFLDEMERPSS